MRMWGRRQAGFSLVEMMISIVIGLIVVAGLIGLLMANRKAYDLQQGNNFNQQSIRFATSRLGWSLRMADFWGGVKPDVITNSAGATGLGGAGDCNAAWVLNKDNGVFGYDGGDTFPITGCIDDANYVKGSDVIVVRYADVHGYDPTKATGTAFDSTAIPDATSVFLVSSVGQQGALFRLGDAVPSSPLGLDAGRYVYPYELDMYYLAPCSDPGIDGDCGTADDGDAAARVPTLMRAHLSTTGALVSEDVVDGVEQLQFEYMTNAKDDANANKYVAASAVSNFASVISVRVGMVARAQVRDVSLPQAGDYVVSGHCSYSVAIDGTVTFPGAASNLCSKTPAANFGDKPQQYARTLSTQMVLLRNRVRG
jgi:type IV pilus assembly protein PilW